MTDVSSKRVVVVGASAAGALTASLLARRGHPVTLVDESSNPGEESRALIVTDRLLALLGDELSSRCTRGLVDRFELHAGGRSATVELTRPDLIIERSALIPDLLAAARDAGATILSGHRFTGFDGDVGVRLQTPAGVEDIAADVVVGADGTSSRVAGAVGVRHRQLSLLQAIVARPPGIGATTSRVWFKPDVTPYFFWMIPEGEARVAVGVITDRPGAARPALDRFLDEEGLEPLEYQAAKVPHHRHVPLHHASGRRVVYLVGDAAAQVKVSTVGGVVTGLRGAAVAAGAISSDRLLLERTRLRAELRLHAVLRRALNGLDEATYARLLAELSESTRRHLGASSRDAAFPMLFRALSRSPRVGLIGIRGLIAASSGSAG